VCNSPSADIVIDEAAKAGASWYICCNKSPHDVFAPGTPARPSAIYMSDQFYQESFTEADVEVLMGPAILNFGANWCGYCQAALPAIARALGAYPEVQQFGIEDGPGRKLGRMFGVKLWPTLVFMKDGKEVTRLVRPTSPDAIRSALAQIA
jgi:thioredoxin 1